MIGKLHTLIRLQHERVNLLYSRVGILERALLDDREHDDLP